MEQREIKFRAWDKEWKMMHYNIQTYDWNQPVFKDGTEFSGLGEFILNKKRFVIQQYTGFKDKNRKEIYEGDIMGWVRKEETLKSGIIIFEDGKYVIQGLGFGNNRFGIDKKKDEVIGNIYENKDLLK